MTFVSKPPLQGHKVLLAGVAVLPILHGHDGVAVTPDGRSRKRSNRVISVSLCPRRKRLRLCFEACGVTYEGRPGTEDPLEAAELGAALRDAIEARLQATGFDEVRLAYQQLRAGRDATATWRSDTRLLLGIASTLALSAPRAVAEATKITRVRPSWSVRPAHTAVLCALR